MTLSSSQGPGPAAARTRLPGLAARLPTGRVARGGPGPGAPDGAPGGRRRRARLLRFRLATPGAGSSGPCGSLQLQLFGGGAAREEAARLRRLHAGFRGTGFDGARYCALDPDAYAWVHLSNFDTRLAFHRWFGPALGPRSRRSSTPSGGRWGACSGSRDHDLPADLDGCRRLRPRHGRAGPWPTTRPCGRCWAACELSGVGAAVAPGPRTRLAGPAPARRFLPPRRHRRHPAAVAAPAPRPALDHGRTAAACRRPRSWCGRRRSPLPDRIAHYPMGARARREARQAGRRAAA